MWVRFWDTEREEFFDFDKNPLVWKAVKALMKKEILDEICKYYIPSPGCIIWKYLEKEPDFEEVLNEVFWIQILVFGG